MRTARELAEEIYDAWCAEGLSRTGYGLINLITAALEEKERERHSGCPCLLVEPCSYACSCANPIMSGGCTRCARYGSENQRRQMAQHLAELPNELEKMDREIERLRESLNGSVRVGESIAGKLVGTENQLAEAVKLLEPFAKEVAYKPHHCAAFPDEASPNFVTLGHCRAAAAFLTKHTHAEKPDGKLQKPLDTHAKPL